MHKIYALFDYLLNQKRGKTIEEFVELAKSKKALYIQYRDKVNIKDIKIKNLKRFRELWDGKLIINDDIELISYCDGVHLGQDDLLTISSDFSKAVEIVRERVGRKIVGLSTHNRDEIEIANRLDLDYIGLGAYRSTNTKDVTDILGASLADLAYYSKHSVAAIGGVRYSDKISNVDFLVLGSGIYED